MSFEKTINVTPYHHNLNRKGLSIRLASHTSELFMNLVVKDQGVIKFVETLHPADARAMRDALIEAYPLQAAEPKATRKPSMSPQAKTVLKHLEREGSISNMEAHVVHKIRALPRRISDLEANGVAIKRETRVDNEGQRYTRYSLAA